MKNADINLISLIERFNSPAACRDFLATLRWPDGVECPRCQGKTISRIVKRDQFDCDSCRYQFSVTAGTIFHDSHLPLWKWFLATYLLCESRKGMSANQIKRTLGISYKTAWYLCHRIRAAMKEVNPEKLEGTVEVDETYVGGKGTGAGRSTKKKDIVIGIRQRGGDLRFIKANDVTSRTLYDIVANNVSNTVDVLITDEFPAYNFDTTQFQKKHKRIKHKETYVVGDVYTNTVESAFSLLKRGIVGTWHRVSAKYLPAYLQEMTWRFNNRTNPFLFRVTIMKLIASSNLEYKELIAA
jgi:transposase-like protein